MVIGEAVEPVGLLKTFAWLEKLKYLFARAVND